MTGYLRAIMLVLLCMGCRSATDTRAQRVTMGRCRTEYRGSGGHTRRTRAPEKYVQAAVIAPAPVDLHPTPGTSLDRSAGCGLPALQASGVFKTHTIATSRRERVYHLRLPDGYNSQRPYPLLFRLHGSSGTGRSGGLDIERVSAKDVIIVAPDGLSQSWDPSTREDDLAMFDALLQHLGARACVDLDRVYAYGFSAGGYFANTLACKRGLLVRAVASIAGNAPEGRCEGQVAAWFLHDTADDSVPIAEGRAAKERARIANGCSKEFDATPDGCVRYRGCRPEEPVVWCETRGTGHSIRGEDAPARVWRFFSSLPR